MNELFLLFPTAIGLYGLVAVIIQRKWFKEDPVQKAENDERMRLLRECK